MKQCMDSENLHRRLRKIIGQVQAIDRMIDEDIPCEDILSQINAAKSALHKAGQVVLEGHINALGHELVDGIQGIGAEMASINSYFHVCDLLDVWVDCLRWFQYNRDLLICKIELLYR